MLQNYVLSNEITIWGISGHFSLLSHVSTHQKQHTLEHFNLRNKSLCVSWINLASSSFYLCFIFEASLIYPHLIQHFKDSLFLIPAISLALLTWLGFSQNFWPHVGYGICKKKKKWTRWDLNNTIFIQSWLYEKIENIKAEVVGSNPTQSISFCVGNTVLIWVHFD